MSGLAEKKISVIPAPVGRPPLGKSAKDTKPVLIRFDAAMRAKIDAALRPAEPLAAFIREAVERELKRRG